MVAVRCKPPIPWRTKMTLCPIALMVSCRKCPAVGACPLKEVIGDYKKTEDAGVERTAMENGRNEKQGE